MEDEILSVVSDEQFWNKLYVAVEEVNVKFVQSILVRLEQFANILCISFTLDVLKEYTPSMLFSLVHFANINHMKPTLSVLKELRSRLFKLLQL